MKIPVLDSFFNKELKATLLKRYSNTRVFLRVLPNFKTTCFEEHLQTAASISCYFDTINLKQSGFCTTYFLKFFFQNENIKIIPKIVNLKKEILIYIMCM